MTDSLVTEFSLLKTILQKYDGRARDALLPALWDIQTAFGHIDREAVHAIANTLRVPAAEIYGVIEFYTLFHDEPTGESIIRVCTDPMCGLAGADRIVDQLCERLNIRPHETSADGLFTIEHSTCLGLCDHAPAALISRRGVGEMSYAPIEDLDCLISDCDNLRPLRVGSNHPVLLAGFVEHRAQTLDEYGGYSGLRHALQTMTSEGVIAEIEASGLVGRGGAAFPTGLKWKLVREAPGQPHYVVCNADESEPGTFTNRVLMESQPHLLLEAMAICGYAVGAERGYIFIRGEYPEATRHLEDAVREAEAAGLLGERVLGTDFTFHLEIRRGAGAYICGEETALFEAIEGKRGFPRIKPPYPNTYGLFGKPTVVNNVETLCAIPSLIVNGAEWFRQWGTERSTGTKLVAVSGHIHRPGVYEISPGMTMRELFEHHCGGVIGNLKAVLMGGASGTFLTPDEIEVQMTFEDLRAIGSTFGSGAVMVFNDTTDLRDVLRRLGIFFQHESCGKCFPCQLGTQRQLEIIGRMDQPLEGDRDRLIDVGMTMTEASLCGLGQTAGSAVMSAIKKWPDLFSA
jgi:NADH-quinone oxidoreductase subunit F